MKNRKIAISILLVILVLLFAYWTRRYTFWLPHWTGDQSHYLALAAKLDKFGLKHYNLKGVDRKMLAMDKQGLLNFVYVVAGDDPHKKGDILDIMERGGVPYYDKPVFHKPPGFPYALVFSHRLFADPAQPPYIVVATIMGDFIYKIKPRVFSQTQFWAVIVPLFFSLGTVLLTFLLGKLLFSYRAGLYACAVMALNPIAIMTSQKLWADDMLTFFMVLSIVLFVLAKKKNSLWLIFISGVTCGIAVLAKQFGGLFFVAAYILMVLTHEKSITNIKNLGAILFDRRAVLFTAGVFLVSGWWFYKIFAEYGNPFYMPSKGAVVETSWVTSWFETLQNRPPGFILYPVGAVYLCPLFGMAIFSFRRFLLNTKAAWRKKDYDYRFILLWLVILIFYLVFFLAREHRYMLPVYPALAILSGYYLDRFRDGAWKPNQYLNKIHVREAVVIGLLVICALISVPIGVKAAVDFKSLILLPFEKLWILGW